MYCIVVSWVLRVGALVESEVLLVGTVAVSGYWASVILQDITDIAK